MNSKYNSVWLFCLILLFTVLQNWWIGFYEDDYAYGALCYAREAKHTALSLGSLLDYLVWHYQHWGGRVLYFFFEISAMQLGMKGFMLVQSLVYAGAIFCGLHTLRLLLGGTKRYDALLLIGLLACLLLFRKALYVGGLYWASASVAYVWPLLPLFAGIVLCYQAALQGQNFTLPRTALLILCFFAAGFSQEQIGLAALVFLPAFALCLPRVALRGLWWPLGCAMGAAALGYGILFCAPGNFARLGGGIAWAEAFAHIPENTVGILERIFNAPSGSVWALGLLVLLLCRRQAAVLYALPLLAMAGTASAVMYISPDMNARMFFPIAFCLSLLTALALPLLLQAGRVRPALAYGIACVALCIGLAVYGSTVWYGYFKNYPTIEANYHNWLAAGAQAVPPQSIVYYRLPVPEAAHRELGFHESPGTAAWMKAFYNLPQSTTIILQPSPYQ
ncbi:MAG: DUF6056 family protein [Desulfovibrionaceae bacterium]|nr:DUF6056 family protein [Desulfovibrionaceae bacterium]